MAIENIDLSQEIESWKSAVRGKDVRAANVAAFEKIQGTVNDTVQNVNQAAEDSASASHNAQAAVDSIQTAIATATEKAAAAATSATQAAGSQAAADSSKTAAAQSETNAAASAAEARQIAEGFGGFDGTAASVTATDTYGLVVAALGESTTQALIDAIANKVINELVAKSQIINNLLATVPGNALDAVQGKKLMDLYTRLNGDWMNLTPYLVNNWEGNGKVAAKKIGNCWIVTLAVRNGVTETGAKILDNLPMSIFGTCVNCYYSVRELHGEAIQAVGNHIKLVQAAPSDSIFANFICSI